MPPGAPPIGSSYCYSHSFCMPAELFILFGALLLIGLLGLIGVVHEMRIGPAEKPPLDLKPQDPPVSSETERVASSPHTLLVICPPKLGAGK